MEAIEVIPRYSDITSPNNFLKLTRDGLELSGENEEEPNNGTNIVGGNFSNHW